MQRGSRIGLKTKHSGPEAVLASRSQSQAANREFATRGIFGPLFIGSSPSAVLQSSLENRLQARMATYGSPEYVLNWRHRDMPSGVPICALRASQRPISDRAYTGWVSPTAMDHRRGVKPPRPWDTGIPLTQQVGIILQGWSTPTAITNTGGAALCKWGGTGSRQKLREAVGNTVLNGALNPAFPLWLMGYPDEWGNCAPQEMPSSRKSARSSLEATSTP